MGEQTSPAIDDGTPVDHVERIFEVSASVEVQDNSHVMRELTGEIISKDSTYHLQNWDVTH